MTTLRLNLEPLWIWSIVALVAIVIVAGIWGGYRLSSQGLSSKRRRLLMGVRFLTGLLLLVSIVRPQLQWISPNGKTSQIWIAGDASRSMSVPDGPGGISRRESLLNTLKNVEGAIEGLNKEVEVTRFDFAESPHEVDTFSGETPGAQTALGSLFQGAARRHAQEPITAIFLLTDGAQRAVPPHDADPRDLASELGELGVSLYPIPIGQASTSSAAADVAVAEIQVDPVVFVKKRVPVRVHVRWDGAGSQRLRVKLLMEDRSGLRAKQSGEMKPLPANSYSQTVVEFDTRYASGTKVVELSFTPELAGEFKIAAAIEPLTGEVQTRNNVRETLITVRKGGLRIAYFDTFRTEIKSVRQLNSSEKLQVDFQMIRPKRFAGGTSIDNSWFEPGRYDVYIIGDVSADHFTPDQLKLLAQRLGDGAGLMMLGGYHTYSAGGYAESPLRQLLPVELHPEQKQSDDVFDTDLQIKAELHLKPTTAGNRHYVMRIDTPAMNNEAWLNLPPLTGATRIRAKSDFVEVLATSEQGDHLILAAETGRSRVMCLAFDETYFWARAGFAQAHRRFWSQAVLWLAHKELDTDQPVWVNIVPKTIDPGGRITLEYGARDEKGQPVSNAKFQVSIISPDGKESLLTGTPTETGQITSFVKTHLPGDYFVRVAATAEGKSIGFAALSRFLVHDRDLEMDHPIVDRELLEELAQLAGMSSDSRIVTPEELKKFLNGYVKRKPWENSLEISASINLWDGWPILMIFATLMTIEWVIRKQGGLV
ncbi:MAG: hypothetical protein JKY95_15870 [Planctomycetaceae bacterium]|nr:hypothetical protein [Planctomycetaceae bacterium]